LGTTIPITPTPDSRTRAAALWSLLALLLVANVPLFLCQHLTSDAVLYDLQARCALDGGVLYRDIVEPNFPGVVWVHMLVRSLCGWSWVALRAFDLLVLSGIAALLAVWVRRSDESVFGVRSALLALSLCGLYFSQSEWCQCQRDTWMLLPALGALHLRLRSVRRILDSASMPPAGRRGLNAIANAAPALIEGALWGAAVWLKPHVIVPAAAVMIVSLFWTGWQRQALGDLLAVLAGALLVGGAGCWWLIRTGAWMPFWEMQLEWNPEYLRAGRSKMSMTRLLSLWESFLPWSWALVLAAASSIYVLKELVMSHWSFVIGHFDTTQSKTPPSDSELSTLNSELLPAALLSALFLGWLAQILALQHPFAYVQIPSLVLAIGIVASWRIPTIYQPAGWMALTAAGLLAALTSPAMRPARLAAWRECLSLSPTPALRARIQVEIAPEWTALAPILEDLRARHLQDGELTAYAGGLIHLYPELNLRPPTRYVYLDVLARLFPSRVGAMQAALENCPQRYIVSSLREAGLSEAAIAGPDDPLTGLPAAFPRERLNEFPYTQPAVLRSGQYVLHRVSEPLGKLCTEYSPLARREEAAAH
jgi:hypothetical protein